MRAVDCDETAFEELRGTLVRGFAGWCWVLIGGAFGGIFFQDIERRLLRGECGLRRSSRFYRDAVLALGCGLLEQFTGEGGDLGIAAGFQPVEQRIGRLPFFASDINLSEMKGVALVAWAQIDGGTLGLQGGGRASAGVAGDRQQIVGVGEFRVPVEHVLQIEHHVGQALYVVMSSLRDAVLEDGNVITYPHVAWIEGIGVAEFRRGFGEFAVLDVVPG